MYLYIVLLPQSHGLSNICNQHDLVHSS